MSIQCSHLTFSYGPVPVLRDVSFSAEGGRLTAVLGPNGAGKTTLFRCILGLAGRYSGSVLLDGEKAEAMPARERAHRIAYIPQIHAPSFGYSVLDMVLMGTAHSVGTLSQPKREQTDAALAALDRLRISPLRDRIFTRLSGGEQQLVLVARALAQNAGTLVMDEPTASLDYGNQDRVLRIIRELADDGYCVLLSTHNPQHAFWFADEALALQDGSVAVAGIPEAVLTPERIRSLYRMDVRLVRTENGLLMEPEAIPGGRKRDVPVDA